MEIREVKRKIFHILAGFVFIDLIYLGLFTPFIGAIVLAAEILLSLICKKYKVPVIYWLLEMMERKDDIKSFPGKGTIFYTLGVLISVFLFPKDVAMAGIVILALGDSIAPMIGQYGSFKNPFTEKKKYLEGTFAGGFAAFLGALIFVSPLEAAIGSAAAMAVEGITIKIGTKDVDDNITMPLAAGVAIGVIRFIMTNFY